jgi:hypothetical protein
MFRGKLETPYVVSYKIKWFAENGWTSRFCGRNLKFVKNDGRKFAV